MQHLVQTLQPYIQHYGNLAVFAAIFLEDFGVPVPGETMLIVASLLAARGRLNIFLVIFIALLAAVLGDNVGYLIGRFGGRSLVLRFGRYVLLTPERLSYAEGFFQRRGAVIVIAARFIEILRQLNGIVAGMTRLGWRRFLIYNSVGAALWVGFWSILFYMLGRKAELFGGLYERYKFLGFAALAVIAGAVVVHVILRRRRKRADRPTGSSG
jgi:membrane protein DedA with SNARE-associated domain